MNSKAPLCQSLGAFFIGENMVTIVNKEPHSSVVKEVICRNCGATLSYVPMEVKEKTYKDYGGGSDTERWIDCPNCNNKQGVKR